MELDFSGMIDALEAQGYVVLKSGELPPWVRPYSYELDGPAAMLMDEGRIYHQQPVPDQLLYILTAQRPDNDAEQWEWLESCALSPEFRRRVRGVIDGAMNADPSTSDAS